MRLGVACIAFALSGCPVSTTLSTGDTGQSDASALGDTMRDAVVAPSDARSTCGAPTLVGTVAVGGLPTAIADDAGFLHITRSGEGVTTVDASDPRAMRVVGSLVPFQMPAGIAAARTFLALTSAPSTSPRELDVLDLTTPSAPRMLYALEDPSFPDRVSLSGNLLVDVSYGGVSTWMLGPSSGTQIGTVPFAVGAESAVARDDTRVVVVTASGTATLVDISSPAAPTIVATGESGTHTYGAVALVGDRVFVGGDALVTMTVTGSTLSVTSSTPFGGMIEGVAPWRGGLLVTGAFIGFTITDLAGTTVQRASYPQGGWDIAVRGDVAFVIDPGPAGAGLASVLALDLCP